MQHDASGRGFLGVCTVLRGLRLDAGWNCSFMDLYMMMAILDRCSLGYKGAEE